MKLAVAAALALLAALFQSLVGPTLPLLNSRPDFPLVLVLAWAMLRGPNEGAAVGFITGLLLDSVSYTPFGVNGALLGIAGYVVGLGETNLYRGNVAYFLGAGALATLIYHTATYLGLQALGFGVPPIVRTYQVAGPAALLNAALLVPVFLLCQRLIRLLTGWRELHV